MPVTGMQTLLKLAGQCSRTQFIVNVIRCKLNTDVEFFPKLETNLTSFYVCYVAPHVIEVFVVFY